MQIRYRRLVLMGLILLGLGACGGSSSKSAGAGDIPGPPPGPTDDPSPGGGVVVSLNPGTVRVPRNGTQVFTAVVSGTSDTAVAWTVDGVANGNAAVGTISGNGTTAIYTAPGSDGNHLLVATSLADTSKRDSTTISVRDSSVPPPSSPTVINAKLAPYRAKGDGTTNDTAAIQSAVNATGGTGGTVLIPSGTYLVDAASGGIALKSNMTLRFETGAVLKAIPTSQSSYRILTVSNAANLNIVGSGVLLGDRYQHSGSGGEHGQGLFIGNNCHDVFVEDLVARDCWGDGFYVNGSSTTDVTLSNVEARDNRRAGISITSVKRLTIRDSVFSGTNGTLGECGLNIEPNGGQTVDDVQILGCTFEGNLGPGIAVGVPCTPNAPGVTAVSNIVIDGNTARNNGEGGLEGDQSGIEVSNCTGTVITNNTCTLNAADGILLRACGTDGAKGANSCTVSGNAVSNNGTAGIHEVYCQGNIIISNHGSGNARWGIRSSYCTGSQISGNDPGLPVTYQN